MSFDRFLSDCVVGPNAAGLAIVFGVVLVILAFDGLDFHRLKAGFKSLTKKRS